jgi:hypothetical protein
MKIHFLKFLGQQAANCVGIVPFERLRPELLDLNQGVLVFGLPGRTAAEGKRTNQKREPKGTFHSYPPCYLDRQPSYVLKRPRFLSAITFDRATFSG